MVLVRKPLDVEREQVVPWWLGAARYATVEKVHMLRLIEQAHGINAESVTHARTHTAVRNDAHTCTFGIGVESVLLANNFGVASEVAEGHAGRDRNFRKRQVEEIGNSAERNIMAGKRPADGGLVADIEGERLRNGVAEQSVDRIGSRLGAGEIGVGQGDLPGIPKLPEIVG